MRMRESKLNELKLKCKRFDTCVTTSLVQNVFGYSLICGGIYKFC